MVVCIHCSITVSTAMEQRLNKQYRDIASERDLLRSLAARLEAHLTHLTQTTERERWVVQEDTVRLRAAERALEEQRTNSLAQLDQERRDMTDSKVGWTTRCTTKS